MLVSVDVTMGQNMATLLTTLSASRACSGRHCVPCTSQAEQILYKRGAAGRPSVGAWLAGTRRRWLSERRAAPWPDRRRVMTPTAAAQAQMERLTLLRSPISWCKLGPQPVGRGLASRAARRESGGPARGAPRRSLCRPLSQQVTPYPLWRLPQHAQDPVLYTQIPTFATLN